MLVSIVIGALGMVYAIAFFTGPYDTKQFLSKNLMEENFDPIDGVDNFFNKGQAFVSTMIILSIVYILLVAANYITASHSRRNYYITNYITIGATVIYLVVYSILGIALLSGCVAAYNSIDWTAYNKMFEDDYVFDLYTPLKSTYPTFIIGYVMYVLPLLNAAALALNVVWKVKLMQGEKALLNGNTAEEVA